MLCKTKSHIGKIPARPSSGAAKSSPAFLRNEDGTLSIFALFMFVMIIGIMGVAIDFTRAERNRATLQHTLDRAILAAADMDQMQAPADVVQDYFATAGLSSTLTDVNAEQGLGYKSLYARAEVKTTAPFLDILQRWGENRKVTNQEELVWDDEAKRWLGPRKYNEMPVSTTISSSAEGSAEERIPLVEISLVLDISGSMADGEKMPNLKAAAKEFVSSVIKPETQDQVSVSLVPYSEQVNAGETVFSQFQTNQLHDFSHCVEFDHSDFNSTAMSLTHLYDQAQHYQWNFDGYANDRSDTVCPRYSYEAIRPITNDAAGLRSQIDQLTPRAGTQIFLGLKWAAALLDPAFQAASASMAANGDVPGTFADRPLSYDNPESLKTIVLMTDGKNSRSQRLVNQIYDSASDRVHWNNYNLWYYLNRYVRSSRHYLYYYEKYSAQLATSYTYSMCNAAKQQGIVIWTIGFEVDQEGANVMRNCASSPSHYFDVEGIEISDAFDAIARQINQLRLTQ